MKRPSLRGHHLICLHFFAGQGYDSKFIANLESAVYRAKSIGATVIEGPDDVCSSCPNLDGSICAESEGAEAEVRNMDSEALRLLGLRPGEAAGWDAISRRLSDAFPLWHKSFCLGPSEFVPGCRWISACRASRHFTALEMKSAMDDIDPYLNEITSRVCPECLNVCCIDRHGTYEENDMIFFNALGAAPEAVTPKLSDAEPCRYLTERGCIRPRWMRPFRCTWYYCPSLMNAFKHENPKKYRRFIELLQRLVATRKRLLGDKADEWPVPPV